MLVCLTVKGEDGGGTIKKTHKFFQACCYIFLNCEVDRCRQLCEHLPIKWKLSYRDGCTLLLWRYRFHNHFFHNHFSSERPEDILFLETSASKKSCSAHCQTLGEVPGLFKFPFVTSGEIKISMVVLWWLNNIQKKHLVSFLTLHTESKHW